MYNGQLLMKNRVLQSIVLVIACLSLVAGLGLYTSRYYSAKTTVKPDIEGLLWPNPRVLQQFDVVDQSNRPFNLDNLQGKWSFLFFGYTHCPDVCPITMALLNQAWKKLAAQNQTENVQMIFVSVDPERDTPEQVAEYVKYFNKDFIGLTGTEDQVGSLANQIGVVHVKDKESAPGEYLVDHSASVFLISPTGQWLAIFSSPHDADNIVNRFIAIREFISKQNA